jgi:glycosyltransferase involved in cell wall biosynthesis
VSYFWRMPLPEKILYATSARIGGSGLDAVAYQTLRGIEDRLGLAIAFDNRSKDLDAKRIKSLRFHPVRFLSNMERKYYYGAKKKTVAKVAARYLEQGRFDLFHGWSGDALQALRVAKRLGIPSVLEVPTWHRQKGKILPEKTLEELAMEQEKAPKRWLNRLLVSRQESLEEYELADLLLVLSERAAETFLAVGVPEHKLYRMSRGVDIERFHPVLKPKGFRVLFVGALIKRKGVHILLEAWKRLRLIDAELWLVGHVHDEIKPYLNDAPDNVRTLGFTHDVEKVYHACHVHVLASELEGSAKSTYEAAACGLAQITTRESGDVVINGENGLVIPPNDVEALETALIRLYQDRDLLEQYGKAGRDRVVQEFTWDHFIERLLNAYESLIEPKSGRSGIKEMMR